MMASELIEELEALVDRHGDTIVTLGYNERQIGEVMPYDENGDLKGKPVEFALIEGDD